MPEDPGVRRLERHQVADARLVDATAVIDHEHVAWLGALEGLEENINAAAVSSRQGAPGEPLPGPARLDVARRAPHIEAGSQASVGNVCRGQGREALPELVKHS